MYFVASLIRIEGPPMYAVLLKLPYFYNRPIQHRVLQSVSAGQWAPAQCIPLYLNFLLDGSLKTRGSYQACAATSFFFRRSHGSPCILVLGLTTAPFRLLSFSLLFFSPIVSTLCLSFSFSFEDEALTWRFISLTQPSVNFFVPSQRSWV